MVPQYKGDLRCIINKTLILSSRDVSLRVTDFHFPQRQTHLECLHGSWDRVVSCQPVDCGLPDPSYVYHAVFSCPRGTTFGKQCSFSCGSPAILQGKLWLCQSDASKNKRVPRLIMPFRLWCWNNYTFTLLKKKSLMPWTWTFSKMNKNRLPVVNLTQ